MLKEGKIFNGFGHIKEVLQSAGFSVYTSNCDGMGTIENNAEQLKNRIECILQETGAEKVNIIGHSKGGLDAKYLIDNLNMASKVASLTCICTPHKGSQVATTVLKMPKFLLYFCAFWVNLFYKILKDKNPDTVAVLKQLASNEDAEVELKTKNHGVYCQSYSATMDGAKADFVMSIPYLISHHYEKDFSDGMVAKNSTVFGEYKGDALPESVSHNEIVCYLTRKKKKEKVSAFYIALCEDLVKRGF